MNPFDNDIFKFFWDNNTSYNENRRKEVLAENPPEINHVADFVSDSENATQMIDKLYFIYRSEVPKYIGWFKNPTHNNGIGGYLPIEFYEDLYKKTSYKSELFPLLPGEAQTDEMLKDYLNNGKDPKINNFHKDSLSNDILKFIIQKHIFQIKFFKDEWWTEESKKITVNEVPFAITFIPERLLKNKDLLDYLINYGENQAKTGFLREFWVKIPKKFKEDPEIFGRWLALIDGGLVSQYKNLYSEPYYTLEGLKVFFREAKIVAFQTWALVKPLWKQELVDIALPKVHGAIAVDNDIELTDDILKETMKYTLSETTRSQIALRLHKENRLTKELIKHLKLTYFGIENLEKKDKESLMYDENIVDSLVERGDTYFLKNKSNWPVNMKIKKEHVIPIMLTLNNSYSRVKSRLLDVLSDENIFIWVYFEAAKSSYKTEIRNTLNLMEIKKDIIINPNTLELIEKIIKVKGTFEDFISVENIFLF